MISIIIIIAIFADRSQSFYTTATRTRPLKYGHAYKAFVTQALLFGVLCVFELMVCGVV